MSSCLTKLLSKYLQAMMGSSDIILYCVDSLAPIISKLYYERDATNKKPHLRVQPINTEDKDNLDSFLFLPFRLSLYVSLSFRNELAIPIAICNRSSFHCNGHN